MNKSLVYAKYKNARISSKKVAPVADLVRGKDALAAKIALTFDPTKASKLLLKVLNSAIANAKHNLGITRENLFVSEVQINGGLVRKTGSIVARGRFSPLLKRHSHIVIGLSERKK